MFNGQTIVVTGAGRGIGAHITRRLIDDEAQVVLVGRSEEALSATAHDLGERASYYVADLGDRESLDRLIAWVHKSHPKLSGLINNAAIQTEMSLLSPKPETLMAQMRTEIAVDLEAPLVLTGGLLGLLAKQPRSFVANITSGLAFAPKEASPAYCAAKAGLHSFTRTLRYQCQRRAPHIQVSEAILPMVATDMTAGRGRGKISAQEAACSICDGIAAGKAEIWVGQAKMLRILRHIAPPAANRILRGEGVPS